MYTSTSKYYIHSIGAKPVIHNRVNYPYGDGDGPGGVVGAYADGDPLLMVGARQDLMTGMDVALVLSAVGAGAAPCADAPPRPAGVRPNHGGDSHAAGRLLVCGGSKALIGSLDQL